MAYGTGFAYGLALQAVEMSVGVGLGLIFLAREGLSFANLRGMGGEGDQPVEEPAELESDQVQEDEPARAGLPG